MTIIVIPVILNMASARIDVNIINFTDERMRKFWSRIIKPGFIIPFGCPL